MSKELELSTLRASLTKARILEAEFACNAIVYGDKGDEVAKQIAKLEADEAKENKPEFRVGQWVTINDVTSNSVYCIESINSGYARFCGFGKSYLIENITPITEPILTEPVSWPTDGKRPDGMGDFDTILICSMDGKKTVVKAKDIVWFKGGASKCTYYQLLKREAGVHNVPKTKRCRCSH